MNLHEQVDELIAGFALGAVDDAEAGLVRRHLPDCEECQATLVRMTQVVAVLPLSLEEVAPPSDLKQRVIAQVSGRGSAQPLSQSAPVEPPATGRLLFLRRVPTWAPVAAAAVLLAAMFGWTSIPRSARPAPAGPSTIQATMVDARHSGVGNVTYMKEQHLALVTFHQLAQPDAGKNYELWVIPAGGSPVASGVFLPEPDGSKVLVITRAIGRGDTIAVTQEPPGGVPRPTGTPIITGQL